MNWESVSCAGRETRVNTAAELARSLTAPDDLLKQIGQGFEVHEMNLPKVVESIYELQARHAQEAQKIVPARV